MKQKFIFLLCVIFLFADRGFATKMVSVGDSDWDQIATWSNSSVPGNPDTIVIGHYVTLSRDLLIEAPTVLIIEDNGSICGDFQLEVACGAKLINRGHVYLNSAIIRNGTNYNEFYSKNSVSLTLCNTPGNDGFLNQAPNGQMKVWPPVLCKTSDTNWPSKGTTNIPVNTPDEFFLSVSPNPLNSGYLSVSTRGNFEIHLYDSHGALIYQGFGKEKTSIDLHTYANGFYFITVFFKDKLVNRKILIDQ